MNEKPKDPWEGHRVSRPIPLDEERKIAEEKQKTPSMFDVFGVKDANVIHKMAKNKTKR